RRRFGPEAAPSVVAAWQAFSAAFREFPYHGGLVYLAPMQFGPANLLWETPTGYRATMVGFPYDDLDAWRAVYPPAVFIAPFDRVAEGFERGLALLSPLSLPGRGVGGEGRSLLIEERDIADACAIHFRSTANQAGFVVARQGLEQAKTADDARPLLAELERVL